MDTFKMFCEDTLEVADCGTMSSVITGFFQNKQNLKKVIANSVTSMTSTFSLSGSGVQYVEMKSLESLEGNVFRGSVNLVEVYAPSVSYIGNYAVYGCYNLEKLTVGVLTGGAVGALTTAFKNTVPISVVTGNTCESLLAATNFPFGLESNRFSQITWHCTDGEVKYINGAWTAVPAASSALVSSRGGGTKCLTPRRSYRRLARPSARFCARSTSHRLEVAA